MALASNELARREGSALVLRPDPLRVSWDLHGLTTSDGHAVTCSFAASVRAVNKNADRQMLAETLLGAAQVATGRDVAAYFESALLAAAQRVARQQTAEQAAAPLWREMSTALQAAAASVAFTCGVELLGPFTLTALLPTFDQQRRQAVQAALLEQRAQAERSRLQHIHQTLEAIEQMRVTHPHLSSRQLVEIAPPAHQQRLLAGMVESEARANPSPPFWCVAGSSLIRVDFPLDGEPAVQVIDVPTAYGPLRSVRWENWGGEQRLLLGTQAGVLVGSAPGEYEFFSASDHLAATGFNSATGRPSADALYAAHGEAGLLRWELDRPGAPSDVQLPDIPLASAPVFASQTRSMLASGSLPSMNNSLAGSAGDRQRPGPRHLLATPEGSLLFSVGAQLCVLENDDAVRVLESVSPAGIIALLMADDQLIIAHEDGAIATIEGLDLQQPPRLVQRRPGRLRSATLIPWLGEQRLLVSSADGALACVGIGDGAVTEFAGPHHDLRMLQATSRAVVAVSSDRQRLVLWNTWDPSRPAAEIHVTARVRHRIADLGAGEGRA